MNPRRKQQFILLVLKITYLKKPQVTSPQDCSDTSEFSLQGVWGEVTGGTLGAIRIQEHLGFPWSCSTLSTLSTWDSVVQDWGPAHLTIHSPGDTLGVTFLSWDIYQNQHHSWEVREGVMSPQIPLLACMLSHFSRVRLFSTPWTAAHQALLAHEILQPRILEWVAIPPSRGSSGPRGQTQVSCSLCLAAGFFTTEPQGKSQVPLGVVQQRSHVQPFAIP